MQHSRFAHTVREGLSQWLGVLGHPPLQPGHLLPHRLVSHTCSTLTVSKSLVLTGPHGSASGTLSAFKGSGSVRNSHRDLQIRRDPWCMCSWHSTDTPKVQDTLTSIKKAVFLVVVSAKPIGNLLPEPARLITTPSSKGLGLDSSFGCLAAAEMKT